MRESLNIESPDRVVLVLIGAGTRAAGFHLGALQALDETGVLARVTQVVALGGGSLAAGKLAVGWGQPTVFESLRQSLLTRSGMTITRRTEPPDPSVARTTQLIHRLTDELAGATLGALRFHRPRFVFGATNLATGRPFFFATGGDDEALAGDEDAAMWSADSVALARAVAASAILPPVHAPTSLALGDGLVSLFGGEASDPVARAATLRRAATVQHVLVVDAGATPIGELGPTDGLAALPRLVDAALAVARHAEHIRFIQELRALGRPDPLWISLHDEGDGEAHTAASVPVDLGALHGPELALLERHGHATTHTIAACLAGLLQRRR